MRPWQSEQKTESDKIRDGIIEFRMEDDLDNPRIIGRVEGIEWPELHMINSLVLQPLPLGIFVDSSGRRLRLAPPRKYYSPHTR